jgi:hypothetical protein
VYFVSALRSVGSSGGGGAVMVGPVLDWAHVVLGSSPARTTNPAAYSDLAAMRRNDRSGIE